MSDTLQIIVTIIGLIGSLITGVFSVRKWLAPLLQSHNRRRAIVNQLLAELGDNGPQVVAGNLRQMQVVIERLAAKLSVVTRRHHLGMYMCDDKGCNVWSNEPLQEMFSMSLDEMTGYGWLNVVQDREKVHHNWRWAVENKTPYNDTYCIVVNGITRKVHTEAFRHCAPDGTILFYVGYVEIVEVKDFEKEK